MIGSPRLRDYLDACHTGPAQLDGWFDDVTRNFAGVIDNTAGVSLTMSSQTSRRGLVVASCTHDPDSHYLKKLGMDHDAGLVVLRASAES